MTDTDAILAMKAELDKVNAELNWLCSNNLQIFVRKSGAQYAVEDSIYNRHYSKFHDTPRAAIREAMEHSK
jgi:hypothetical protein